MKNMLRLIVCLLSIGMISTQLCTSSNIDLVTRIVFGEARGEPANGQLAVAYTVVNRVGHSGFPNTVFAVVDERTSNGRHQYETLDLPGHDASYQRAKSMNTPEYKSSRQAAGDALCGRQTDPTSCAVSFCTYELCPAIIGNQWWSAVNKRKIGRHYFVCLQAN